MENEFQYERRFVAFVDILGFSSLIQDPRQSARYARSLYNLMTSLIDPESCFKEGEHVETGERVEFEFYASFTRGGRLTTISDSIVLSCPEFSDSSNNDEASRTLQILACLETLGDLQAALLAMGVLARGGFSVGKLHHGTMLTIGDGLVRAYELESKVANVPRILIDDEVMSILLSDDVPTSVLGVRSRIANHVAVDTDGRFFVDFLCFKGVGVRVMYLEEELPKMQKTIQLRLEVTGQERVRQKLEWVADYLEAVRKSFSGDGVKQYLQRNAGTAFHEKYPRSFENLRHMLANWAANGRQYVDYWSA